MPRFLLIDHSLSEIGSHHFDFAQLMLAAAEEAGFEPLVATHRDFRDVSGQLSRWQVIPTFHFGMYNKYCLFTATPERLQTWREKYADERQSQSPREWLLTLPSRAKSYWREVRRARRLRLFIADVRRLFRQVPLQAGDHVIWPTVSEFDFLGLAKAVGNLRGARDAQWHLLFHTAIFEGRPGNHDHRQLFRMRKAHDEFRQALRAAPDIPFHLYVTCEQLKRQYEQLGLARFHLLPYPVSETIAPVVRKAGHPIRVTCPGIIRREKGQSGLARTVSELWNDYFATGQIQLVVQGSPSDVCLAPSGAESVPGRPPAIDHVQYPLDESGYQELLRQADVGLLNYDGERYYARTAGVLREFLCAGVPVIVPAGCWPSEQIAEANFNYLDRQAHQISESSLLSAGPCECRAALSSLQTVRVPAGTGEALLTWKWRGEAPDGAYVRLELEQWDDRGQSLERFAFVIGDRSGGRPMRAMWHLQPDTQSVRVSYRNAYDDRQLLLADVTLGWLPRCESRPLGAVGLVAAEEGQLAALIREMVAHHAHYTSTAREFAVAWGAFHRAPNTLAALTAKTTGDASRPNPSLTRAG